MTLGKSAAITAGFVGAFGIGIWASPYFMGQRMTPDTVAPVETASVPESPVAIAPHDAVKPHPASFVVSSDRTATFAPLTTELVVDTPELHQRLRPLLKHGANMEVAADGFRSAEQFATVVHASQNTEVPFMVLKHRVLDEGDTLVAAIRKSKPALDAVVEADRARAEARSDIASLD